MQIDVTYTQRTGAVLAVHCCVSIQGHPGLSDTFAGDERCCRNQVSPYRCRSSTSGCDFLRLVVGSSCPGLCHGLKSFCCIQLRKGSCTAAFMVRDSNKSTAARQQQIYRATAPFCRNIWKDFASLRSIPYKVVVTCDVDASIVFWILLSTSIR